MQGQKPPQQQQPQKKAFAPSSVQPRLRQAQPDSFKKVVIDINNQALKNLAADAKPEPAQEKDPIAVTIVQRKGLGGLNNFATEQEVKSRKLKVFGTAPNLQLSDGPPVVNFI